MRLAMRAQSIQKKTTLITVAFILALSVLTAGVSFVLSQRANAAGQTTVNSWTELKDALASSEWDKITLASDITIEADNTYAFGDNFTGREDTLVVSRPVIIDGLDHTITMTGNATGWQANYVLQVYNTSDVIINSLRLTGGDAGLVVNGSAVKLTGNNHVTGNEFGGIELAKGSGVTTEPSLTIPTGFSFGLWNFTEDITRPTLWADPAQTASYQVNTDLLYRGGAGPNNNAYYTSFANTGSALSAPQPTSPQNGGTVWNDKNAVFGWNAATNATQYEVRYSKGPGRTPNANNGELNSSDAVNLPLTSATSLTFELPSYGTWFWQVRSVNGSVKSPWSNIWATKRATSSTVTVTPDALNGWVLSGTVGGQSKLKTVASPTESLGALNLVTDSNVQARANATLLQDFAFKDIDSLSYKTRANSTSIPEGSAAYRVQIDADGNPATTSDNATLVHEPYWQNASPDAAPVVPGVWQSWDVKAGLFWASIPTGNTVTGLTNGAGGPPLYTYNDLKTILPNAKVISISTGIGSYNVNYNVDVDSLVIGKVVDGATTVTTYNFEPDTTAPTAPTLATATPYVANGAVKNLQWNAPTDTDVAYYEYAEYNFTAPTSETTPPSWLKTVNAPTTQTTDTAWGSDITIYWRVRAVDTSGNASPWSETRTIVTDRTAPGLPGVPTTSSPTNSSTIVWTWSPATDASAGVKGYEYALVSDGSTPTSWAFTTETTASTPVTADGTYRLYVRAVDVADNKGGEVVSDAKFIDVTAPNPTINALTTSATATPTISGTLDDATASLFMSIDGSTDLIPLSVVGGIWEYTFTAENALTEGDHTIDVIAGDAAGNSRVASATLAVAFPVIIVPGNQGSTDGGQQAGDDDDQTVLTPLATPAIINPGAVQQVLGDATTNEQANTADNEGTPEVEGASTLKNLAQAVNSDNQGRFFGLAWYWWIIILAAIALVIWWIAAAVRRKAEN